MPVESSGNKISPQASVFEIPLSKRLAMVAMGYVPLVHLCLALTAVFVPMMGWGPIWLLWLAPVVLYLVPPLIVRFVAKVLPVEEGTCLLTSNNFLRWWFTAQCQILFNRLSILEELLRLVPGLYSFWLRLWGARVGRLVYWSPGTVVLDRSLVRIGKHVVLGAGARLHPHVITRDDAGNGQLILAPVIVEDRATVGGMSLLTAGARVHANEMTPAFTILPPFAEWLDGHRVRKPASDKASE